MKRTAHPIDDLRTGPLSIILIGASIALTINAKVNRMSQLSGEEKSGAAIKKLWSPDDRERELGKREILESPGKNLAR